MPAQIAFKSVRWQQAKISFDILRKHDIIYLARQPEGSWYLPIPVKLIKRNSRPLYFSRVQGGYFLFFTFRIATIKRPTVKIIINSSYVLISIPPSARLGMGICRLSGCHAKYIIVNVLLPVTAYLLLSFSIALSIKSFLIRK